MLTGEGTQGHFGLTERFGLRATEASAREWGDQVSPGRKPEGWEPEAGGGRGLETPMTLGPSWLSGA